MTYGLVGDEMWVVEDFIMNHVGIVNVLGSEYTQSLSDSIREYITSRLFVLTVTRTSPGDYQL